jgi:carbon monoxide dehydrogenase subunit G
MRADTATIPAEASANVPEVTQSFTIDQPVARVWSFFQDVPQVVTCVPGLELVGQTGAATYQGKVKVKLGPITAAFEGEATIVETDATAHSARIDAKGVDRKGGSRATASLGYALTPAGDGTAVALAGDIKLTGALAQIGRTGIIQDVADQLTEEFAKALRAKLAATAPAETGAPAPASGSTTAPPPAAVSGGRFLLAILWRRLKRTLRTLSRRERAG